MATGSEVEQIFFGFLEEMKGPMAIDHGHEVYVVNGNKREDKKKQ